MNNNSVGLATTVQEIKSGPWQLTLSPDHGGAILKCTYEGHNILRPTPPNWYEKPLMFETGYFPLAPYSNRIKSGKFSFDDKKIEIAPNYPSEAHPIHGFAWQEKWDVAALATNYIALTMEFEAQKGVWPWSVALTQTIRIVGNRLKFFLSAKNIDNSAMPIGLGFHPYFANYDKLSFQCELTRIQDLNENKVPKSAKFSALTRSHSGRLIAKEYPVDNCFTAGKAPTRIFWDDRPWHLEVEASDNLPYRIICSHPKGKNFCIEPVTHINNGLGFLSSSHATGIKILGPNEEFNIEMSLVVVK